MPPYASWPCCRPLGDLGLQPLYVQFLLYEMRVVPTGWEVRGAAVASVPPPGGAWFFFLGFETDCFVVCLLGTFFLLPLYLSDPQITLGLSVEFMYSSTFFFLSFYTSSPKSSLC